MAIRRSLSALSTAAKAASAEAPKAPFLSSSIDRLGTESAFKVSARAAQLAAEGKNIINLGIGQVRRVVPETLASVIFCYPAINSLISRRRTTLSPLE